MTIPFAVRSNQEGINTGRPLIGSHNSHICNMDDGHLALWLRVVRRLGLRWGIIFSKGLGDNSLLFSLCGWRSGVFYACFCSSLEACLEACLGIFSGLKRQTRMRTSWNVPSFYRRTRMCAQLRSERTEDGMRTYFGRVERSVNEVVKLWTREDVMGTK